MESFTFLACLCQSRGLWEGIFHLTNCLFWHVTVCMYRGLILTVCNSQDKGKLMTYVIASGLQYGCGENVLHSFFKVNGFFFCSWAWNEVLLDQVHFSLSVFISSLHAVSPCWSYLHVMCHACTRMRVSLSILMVIFTSCYPCCTWLSTLISHHAMSMLFTAIHATLLSRF